MPPKNQLSTQIIINAFVLDRRTRGLTPRTIHYYKDELNRFANWIGVNVSMLDISPDLIRSYLDHLSTTRTHGGIHAAWRAIRAFFRWFEQEFEPEDWRNPVDKVHIRGPSRQALPGVAMATIQRLIDACDTEQALRDQSVFLILLDTGCRATEFINLNIGDLDYATGALRIRHGKGDKARSVFLGERARRKVRKYLRTRNQDPDHPLITTDDGERFTYNGLVSLVRRRSEEAGVERPRLHDFRRTFAVQMLRNGCDLARLAALLGHETLEITRRYLKFVDEDLQIAHAQASPADRWKL